MNKVSYEIIEINNVFFYVEQQVLVMKDGSKKKVPESELKIILALVNAEGKELTRDELLNIGWGDVIVNESSLIQAISNIRKKISDTDRIKKILITSSSGGYFLKEESVRIHGEIVVEKNTSYIYVPFFFLLFIAFSVVYSIEVYEKLYHLDQSGGYLVDDVSVFPIKLGIDKKLNLEFVISRLIDLDKDYLYFSASDDLLTVSSLEKNSDNLIFLNWSNDTENVIEIINENQK